MEFEWDERKRKSNLMKHGLDFLDAIPLFTDVATYEFRSPVSEEPRWVRVGQLGPVAVTVIYTWRGDRIRIISFRRARRNEKDYLTR